MLPGRPGHLFRTASITRWRLPRSATPAWSRRIFASLAARDALHSTRMRLTRRDWLSMTTLGGLTCLTSTGRAAVSEREARILALIQAYENQGFHRTATSVDNASGEWLFDEVKRAGLTPTREAFPIDRVDPIAATLTAGDRTIEGLPLFDGGFTDARGIGGRLSPLSGDGAIGLVEAAPNTAGAGALGAARRANRFQALVCVTRGGRPGLCPNNADAFLAPFGPPVLQVSSEDADWLSTLSADGSTVHVVVAAARTKADAFNVTARIAGADASLPPLVIMTPRSGWYSCASERGGGIACWLELMRTLRVPRPRRDILFVASSGHELGHLGINAFVARRRGIVPTSAGWMHFGANVGAATDPRNTIQTSDDEFERLLEEAMRTAGLRVDVRVPRGTAPAGEAEVIHSEHGRYVSAIGRSALFHNRADRGPGAIDIATIAAFCDAFTALARTLSA